jgi:predicted CoA-binding protein
MSDPQPDPASPILQHVETIAMVGASSNCAATAVGSVMTLFSH